MPRKTLLVLFLVSVAVNLFFIGKRIYFSHFRMATDYVYSTEDYMKAAAEMQSNLPIDSNSIVVLGNSLSSNFPLYELFPGLPVKNRGVSSNQTIHILNRVKGIAQCRPKIILIEGGINDLAAGRSVDSTMLVYKQIIASIKETSPNTRIIMQSTLPVCGTSAALMPKVNQLNQALNEYANEQNLTFIDVGIALKKDGQLNSAYTWDGIHLNYEGYKIWAGIIKPLIV